MRKLTNKQKLFVKEYLIDLNATQAAIRSGYSEATASNIGRELLQKTTVANAIQKVMDKRTERTYEEEQKLIEQDINTQGLVLDEPATV